MLERWAALPPRIRRLAGTAAAVLGLAVVWALFVPLADWLARHDVGSVTGPLHETALDNARGRLLTLGAGLVALVAVGFTARTFWLSREGQVTDRYTKAIEQLGSDKLDVRIGAIYALERIARDSARDHPVVMEVLTAFVREHSREPWPEAEPGAEVPERTTRPDVQAAVSVIGRRDRRHDLQPVDMAGSVLSGADLSGAYLGGGYLLRANLRGVKLARANLAGAYLSGAYLGGADLTRAFLTAADLRGADLTDVNLRGADLRAADLGSVTLYSADRRSAVAVPGADLRGAQFTGADLTGARWPKDARVPEGWELNTGTGRLQRADADPGPAEAD